MQAGLDRIVKEGLDTSGPGKNDLIGNENIKPIHIPEIIAMAGA